MIEGMLPPDKLQHLMNETKMRVHNKSKTQTNRQPSTAQHPKSTGQVSAKATVSVSIKHWQENDTFSYHINGDQTPVRFDRIEDELIELLQSEDDPTFSIYADETVPIKEVVAVMNIAKRNHYKVIMATSPE